jgi:hypothetical protein
MGTYKEIKDTIFSKIDNDIAKSKAAIDQYKLDKGNTDLSLREQRAEKQTALLETERLIEKHLEQLESKRVLNEDSTTISLKVQEFLDKCDRLSKILQDDKLFEKEKQKYQK